MRCPRKTGGEVGETLVEVLVAVTILGLAGVAIMAGMGLAVKSSDIHRKETTGSAYVRSYAEAVENWVRSDSSHYVACAPADTYTPAAVGFGVPSGYTASQAAASAVSAVGGTTAPCSADSGIQQVLLTVASADARASETLTVVLRKPCAGSGADPCA